MKLAIVLDLLMKLCWEDDLQNQKKCYLTAIECVERFRGKVSLDDIYFQCSKPLLKAEKK